MCTNPLHPAPSPTLWQAGVGLMKVGNGGALLGSGRLPSDRAPHSTCAFWRRLAGHRLPCGAAAVGRRVCKSCDQVEGERERQPGGSRHGGGDDGQRGV